MLNVLQRLVSLVWGLPMRSGWHLEVSERYWMIMGLRIHNTPRSIPIPHRCYRMCRQTSTLNCSYSNSHKQIQQKMYKMVKFDTRKCKTNISFHNDTLADGKMLTGFIYMYIVLFWRFFLFCSTFVNILPVSPFFDKNWI